MNFGIMIIIVIVGLWALGVFLGAIGKLTSPSHNPAAIDSSEIKSQEQKTIDETEAKRQKLMDDMKQQIEDRSKKY